MRQSAAGCRVSGLRVVVAEFCCHFRLQVAMLLAPDIPTDVRTVNLKSQRYGLIISQSTKSPKRIEGFCAYVFSFISWGRRTILMETSGGPANNLPSATPSVRPSLSIHATGYGFSILVPLRLAESKLKPKRQKDCVCHANHPQLRLSSRSIEIHLAPPRRETVRYLTLVPTATLLVRPSARRPSSQHEPPIADLQDRQQEKHPAEQNFQRT